MAGLDTHTRLPLLPVSHGLAIDIFELQADITAAITLVTATLRYCYDGRH